MRVRFAYKIVYLTLALMHKTDAYIVTFFYWDIIEQKLTNKKNQ